MAESKAGNSTRKSGNSTRKAGSTTRKAGSTARKRPSKGKGKPRSRQPKSKLATVETAAKDTAKDAGQAAGRAANKAKVPLIAGGAALMGAASGFAVASRVRRHGRGGVGTLVPRPQIKVDSSDLRHAAQEVGSFGAQVGRLASELQSVREATNGGRGQRSPIEVVLDGLTSRRGRA